MTTGGSGSGDPFFGELRRLQPDIDIVVLPPDETPPDAPRLGSDRRTLHEAEVEVEVERTLADLLAGVGLRGMVRTSRWRRTRGRAHRFVATASRGRLTPDAAITGLRVVRDALVDSPDWDAHPVPGKGARLSARSTRADLTVDAHATPSSLVVLVSGDPVVPDTSVPGGDDDG